MIRSSPRQSYSGKYRHAAAVAAPAIFATSFEEAPKKRNAPEEAGAPFACLQRPKGCRSTASLDWSTASEPRGSGRMHQQADHAERLPCGARHAVLGSSKAMLRFEAHLVIAPALALAR